MGNIKAKRHDNESSGQDIEWKDPILAEVRKARVELGKEIERDAEGVHKRALQHAKELGFSIAKLKPVRPKPSKR